MKSTWSFWMTALLTPPALFVSMTMGVWPAPSILGYVSDAFMTVATAGVLFVFFGLPASAYEVVRAVVACRRPAEWRRRLSRAAAWLCLFCFGIATLGWATEYRFRRFEDASRVGDRIVAALAKHREDQRHYPEELEGLTPEYLASIPGTGLIGYPTFRYRRDYHDIEHRPGEYELRINCPSGGINFDRLIYWPAEEYPPRIQGNGVSRVGRWAYVHE